MCYRDGWVQITQNWKIECGITFQFDDVFAAVFIASNILKKCNRNLREGSQIQQIVDLLAFSSCNMVNDNAVLNLIHIQHDSTFFSVIGSGMFSRAIMSAMRI